MAILIQANAKINLKLEIIKKLPTGLHQIKSTFQSVDLSDFLLFQKASKDEFTGAIICPEAKNIISKAKQALEKFVDKKLPCQIHLQKSIPISAGLGGGSANAAATLVALNKLYNLNLSRKELAEIGVKVGADVPFFFYGGTCKVEGVGEKVTQIKKPVSKFFVFFRPHKRLETKMMYQLYDQTGKTFFQIVKDICPDIKKLEQYFKKFPVRESGLSGSGPTVFAGVRSHKLAKEIVEGYQAFNGDIFICRPQNKALNIIKL